MNLLIVLAVCVLIALAISSASAKQHEKAYHEQRANDPHPPAHGMVDNQPGTGALVLAWVIIAVIVLAAVCTHIV